MNTTQRLRPLDWTARLIVALFSLSILAAGGNVFADASDESVAATKGEESEFRTPWAYHDRGVRARRTIRPRHEGQKPLFPIREASESARAEGESVQKAEEITPAAKDGATTDAEVSKANGESRTRWAYHDRGVRGRRSTSPSYEGQKSIVPVRNS